MLIRLPSGIDQAPSSGTAIYKLTIQPESATNGGYTIEAAAAPIAQDAMQDDTCDTFIIDATGAKTNRTSTLLDAAQSARCWTGRS